ncbi:MAG TPA: hypothetical protein VJ890_11485, partial [Vineibacter sp.]|nr:hypothetical protein [Vineibacter sp.]
MAMNKTMSALLVTVAVLAGLGGFLVGQRGDPFATTTASTPVPAAKPAPTPAAAKQADAAPKPATTPPAASPTPAAPSPAAFRFARLTVSADATPEACLHFSQELDDSGRVKYGDYLAITPDAKPAIVVRQERICLGGLAYGANYEVEIKAGL